MRYNIEYAIDLGEMYGLRCLDSEYYTLDIKMNWMCSKRSHKFEAKCSTIRLGGGCFRCRNIDQEAKALSLANGNNISRIFRDWKGENNIWECKFKHSLTRSNEEVIENDGKCPICVKFITYIKKINAEQKVKITAFDKNAGEHNRLECLSCSAKWVSSMNDVDGMNCKICPELDDNLSEWLFKLNDAFNLDTYEIIAKEREKLAILAIHRANIAAEMALEKERENKVCENLYEMSVHSNEKAGYYHITLRSFLAAR